MGETRIWHFAPFRLDVEDERLWRGTEAVRLTAKAFGGLRYLVAPAGQLVPKDELCAAVWTSGYVSDATLAVCIRELRVEAVETSCNAFARRGQFLRALDPVEWPDGTLTARHRFLHILHRDAVYERRRPSRPTAQGGGCRA